MMRDAGYIQDEWIRISTKVKLTVKGESVSGTVTSATNETISEVEATKHSINLLNPKVQSSKSQIYNCTVSRTEAGAITGTSTET